MTYDVLIGLPGRRLIRLTDLNRYLDEERSAQSARATKLADLPEPVRNAGERLRQQWPSFHPFTAGIDNLAPGYWLGVTSFYAGFDDSDAQAVHAAVVAIASEEGLLFFDPMSGGWLDAQLPSGEFLSMAGFTSERCVMQLIARDDVARLLDPVWFTQGRFFCFAPGDAHFLQVLNHGNEIIVEFRSAPGRPVYRARMTRLAPVVALVEGYLRGENMNTQEYHFAPLTAPEALVGLPPRDDSGRWKPQTPQPGVTLQFAWRDNPT